MGLSKNQSKLIKSLEQKKYRIKEQLFVAEGVKVVKEFLASDFDLETLFVTPAMSHHFSEVSFQEINDIELKKISSLKSPNGVLALFKTPKKQPYEDNGLVVALDTVNDPGNLGTIIRLCDWFGVKQLICSENTVDCYNSKVVQATMGSLTRVNINYVPLHKVLSESILPVFCADMEGENVYATKLPSEGILVMGNEANGISSEIRNICNQILTIPRFGDLQETESLNVATATAILLNEFKRSTFQ
mgnify:CR=1 FL=1